MSSGEQASASVDAAERALAGVALRGLDVVRHRKRQPAHIGPVWVSLCNVSDNGAKRCVLGFARSLRDEERAKCMPGASALFNASLHGLTAALGAYPDIAVAVATPSAPAASVAMAV